MDTDPSVSVIIPVFNEERTVPSVVQAVLAWGKAREVIVVDDGSVDQSRKALAQFGMQITLLKHKKNRGKGWALASGIEESTGDIILFLDSDLVGLTSNDLDRLVEPVCRGRAEMAIGSVRLWTNAKTQPFLDTLSGERVVKRSRLIPYLDQMKKTGFGIEMLLNRIHAETAVEKVSLPFVSIVGKFSKYSPTKAAKSYVLEARDLLLQFANQNAKELTPQANRLLSRIGSYLKAMVE